MLKFPNSDYPADLNMQTGFARMFLFNGLTAGNQDFLTRAALIAYRAKGNVSVNDPCSINYNFHVFRLDNSNNSYWWYHRGWRVEKYNCYNPPFGFHTNVPSYAKYTEYFEDISHGLHDVIMMRDFYNFQPSTPVSQTDMVRFRNTFTNNIYDGNGGFYNSVKGGSGNNSQIFNNDCGVGAVGNPPCQHNILRNRSLSYMPFAAYDNLAGTSPNVYEVIMDYYIADILGHTTVPYSGLDNRGHAYVVAEQWKRECTNLTLYNRKMVYNQDFFAKNDLIVEPGGFNHFTYAEPKSINNSSPDFFDTDEFIVSSGVEVNMSAANQIVLKAGFKAEQGSRFVASINPALCTNGMRIGNPNESGDGTYFGLRSSLSKDSIARIIQEQEKLTPPVSSIYSFNIYPNPNAGQFTIVLDNANGSLIEIYDVMGKKVWSKVVLENKIKLDISGHPKGIYLVKVLNGNDVSMQKVVYE